MRHTLMHPTLGEIVYEENFWTGKKAICVGGKSLYKLNKTTYALGTGDEKKVFTLSGNSYFGASLTVDGETIQIVPKSKWYELALSALIVAFNIVWGNSVVLCSIIPIVGGGIGGAISAGMAMVALLKMKETDEIWKKVLIALGFFLASLLACFVLGIAFLSVLY
ncbi:MAG: hypothetical protein IJW93_03000 [Clostridia bacterium]|nr:hypothetical protein [Clostridia bacterium]